MHQISEVLQWPEVTDLYPHIGMQPDAWADEEHPTTTQNSAQSGGSALVVCAGVHFREVTDYGAWFDLDRGDVLFLTHAQFFDLFGFQAAGRAAAAQAQRAAAVGLTTAPDGNHGDNR